MREYSVVMLSGKVVLGLGLIGCILGGGYEFKPLYISYICSVFIPLLLGGYWCRNCFTWPHRVSFNAFLSEAKENLSAGSQLMLANIASVLIIGIIRYGISNGWDISTFGKVSLTLSVSNFVLTFISAISIAVFPVIKQLNKQNMIKLYSGLRFLMTYGLLGFMIFYFPVYIGLFYWLPQYRDALIFMILLFPICVYESKVQILSNTYFKSLRKERVMLLINASMVIISILLTIINVYIAHNLWGTVFSILLVNFIRSLISELVLVRFVGIKTYREIIIEIIYVAIFIFLGLSFNTLIATLTYVSVYVLLIVSNWRSIKSNINLLRQL